MEARDEAKKSGEAQFGVGTCVSHRRFGYRGVVIDVDAVFDGTDEWYEKMAKSRPPKDRPWYHVLVHDSDHMTYVAERNLEADDSPEPIRHPMLEEYLHDFDGERYRTRCALN